MKTHFISVGVYCLLLFSSCSVQQPVSGTRTGNIAPEISAVDPGGNILTLSSQRGKYVLVEFWESGNSQARKNHFEMGRLYQKYRAASFEKANGFTIFSFSIDTDKNKWLGAIREDFVVWPMQVIDTSSWNSKILLDYSIGSLPKYFLLDNEGKILEHNIIIADLEKILIKYLE